MNWQDKVYENLTEGYVDEGLGAVVRAGHEKVRKFLGKNVHPSLHSKKEKTRRQIGKTVRNIQAADQAAADKEFRAGAPARKEAQKKKFAAEEAARKEKARRSTSKYDPHKPEKSDYPSPASRDYPRSHQR